MNFTDLITSHGKRVTKEAFRYLVQVSRVDGKINSDELELLHKEGKKFGLTDPEIDKLINSESDSHYHAPYALEEKFEHFYNIAEMIMADDVVNEKERKMLKRFAIEAGFEFSKIDGLIELILDGIEKNTEEEALFVKFKKKLLH
jgi:uncharacterized tellurite resistance protein B-like protein